MPNLKDQYVGVPAGRPTLVMRTVQIPMTLTHEPDRPAVFAVHLSKLPQLMRALAKIHATGVGTSALMELLDAEGIGGTPTEAPDRT